MINEEVKSFVGEMMQTSHSFISFFIFYKSKLKERATGSESRLRALTGNHAL